MKQKKAVSILCLVLAVLMILTLFLIKFIYRNRQKAIKAEG